MLMITELLSTQDATAGRRRYTEGMGHSSHTLHIPPPPSCSENMVIIDQHTLRSFNEVVLVCVVLC